MRGILVGVLVFFCISVNAAPIPVEEKLAIAKERCAPYKEGDAVLYRDKFKFGQTREAMAELYSEVYESEDRLKNRIGFYANEGFVSGTEEGRKTLFPEHYLQAVIKQVENALRLTYVEHVFYSDMGHSHLFIPQDYYQEHMAGGGRTFYESLSVALESTELKTLYHTAEQLEMLDENKEILKDRYIQWRFHTRNPTGDNQGNLEILTDFSEQVNTVRDYPSGNHRFYAGFYISANKNGCFPFEQKDGSVAYFDISVDSPEYSGGAGLDYGL